VGLIGLNRVFISSEEAFLARRRHAVQDVKQFLRSGLEAFRFLPLVPPMPNVDFSPSIELI
jgi:hypothetical protein